MNSRICKIIEDNLSSEIVDVTSLSGGCINDAYKIKSAKGELFFLKQNTAGKMFHCEANGLNELRKSKSIKVPEVYSVGDEYILTEFIEQGKYPPRFYELFGHQFAVMHKYSSDNFGFYENNFIGSTTQLNIPDDEERSNWTSFYFNKRLLYQYRLTEKNGYGEAELNKYFRIIESKIDFILSGSENLASILHGDLWSGNFICSKSGEVYLIDPAVYYGNREADLAMTKLFGSFNNEFYSAYDEVFPLPPGSAYRENIYKLYHVLNHLNRFGSSYYNQAVSLMKHYS
jgi:protein-ribulosamine 3-kinase